MSRNLRRIDFLLLESQTRYNEITAGADNPLPPKKTATLNLRIDPAIKEAARIAAQKDNRSLANLVEVLIRRHCEKAGIPIPEQLCLIEDEPGG